MASRSSCDDGEAARPHSKHLGPSSDGPTREGAIGEGPAPSAAVTYLAGGDVVRAPSTVTDAGGDASLTAASGPTGAPPSRRRGGRSRTLVARGQDTQTVAVPGAASGFNVARVAEDADAGATLGGAHADPRVPADASNRVLVIACGAIARELLTIARTGPLAQTMDITCLPAIWHNTPERIVPGVAAKLAWARGHYGRVFVAYADCGTGGALDRLLAEHPDVERLPGAHCYAFFSGVGAFEANAEQDLRSFFLTDYLARHFTTLVWEGLALDRHPELRAQVFGHYERVVYLSQTEDADLVNAARAAAARLGLMFEHRHVGYGDVPSVLDGVGR